MKINWKVRFNNPQFIGQLFVSVGAPILAYMGLTVGDITTWAILGQTLVDAISNPYVIGLAIFLFYNAVNDPTTPGLKDSWQALRYKKPGKR